MKTGVIIGKAEIYEVKSYKNANEIKKDQKFHFASKKFQKKTYGFMLKNAKALRVPIPWKGQLGFFEVDLQKQNEQSQKFDHRNY